MRIALTTLGCKLNQYETWQMASSLAKAEIVPFSEIADIYVVNTCTVTKHSDFRSRQLIRQAKRRNPEARVIVTGCYAQTQKEVLSALPEVDLVMPNEDKSSILAVINSLSQEKLPVNETLEAGFLADYTRAFVKIQDGCDNQCSYCVVRIARGRQKSVTPEAVIEEVSRLSEKGYQEVVLTGIQLGGYGTDLSQTTSLARLLLSLGAVKSLRRLRLSSIEPLNFTDELIEIMTSLDNLCHHFHIPLQSGDDEILRKMNRDYSASDFWKLVNRLKNNFPEMGLGTDVIVGFPGETDSQFENTYNLIEELPFSYLHVFSFSPRPGTAAAQMPAQVMPEIIKQRSQRLRALGKEKKLSFQKIFVGQTLSVLIEKKYDDETGFLTGLSDNYLRIFTENDDKIINKICNINIHKIYNNKMLGRVT